MTLVELRKGFGCGAGVKEQVLAYHRALNECIDRIEMLESVIKSLEGRLDSQRGQTERAQKEVESLRAQIKANTPPDCSTCANKGKIDGLSQETHCEHCKWASLKWIAKSHYVAKE